MCDSPELLAALATLTRAVEKQTLKRGFIDQTYEVSDTQGFILDYKGYRYLFVYAGTSLTFLIGSSSYSIAANTWTPLQFKEGYKIFTSGTANPTGIRVRATDDLFAIIASATVSIAANASVNVNEVAGTATSVNNGTTDAGTQRVTLSSDSTGQVKLASGSLAGRTKSSTGTPSSVNSANSDTTILASNSSRLGASIYNDSTQILYLLVASAVSSTSTYTVQVSPQQYFELPGPYIYTGVIKGIWAAANGAARITEWT